MGCTLVEDLDGYAGTGADAAAFEAAIPGVDASSDAVGADTFAPDAPVADAFEPETVAADTFAPDTAVPDTALPDTALPDTAVADTRTADAGTEAPPPYRRVVALDGKNDFTAAEKIATTTAGFDAYVSWDDAYLYVAYVGSDLGTGALGASAKKWVLVYVDTDPGAGAGASASEAYGSQQHAFPASFRPDVYYALKTDESFQQLRRYTGGAWVNATGAASFARDGAAGFVELRIPWSALTATPTRLGVTTFMLNEDTTGPWTWAGLWSTSFTDGTSPVAAPKTIANWLQVDLASSQPPNAAANKRP
jgi:hypothetical protein